MSTFEKQSKEQCSSNETVEMLPMEPVRRRREAGNDANTYSENSISVSDKATEPRNLELTFQLASSNRFNTELDTLQERIQFLDVKLEVAKEVTIMEIEDAHSGIFLKRWAIAAPSKDHEIINLKRIE